MQSILTNPTGKLSPKHHPAATFLFRPSVACCCWQHPPVGCVYLSPPSSHRSASPSSLPRVLSTCPLTGAAREDFSTKSQADSETWQLARCTSTHPLVIQMLSSFYGSWTPHFDLKECMAREYVTSQNSRHKKKTDRQT